MEAFGSNEKSVGDSEKNIQNLNSKIGQLIMKNYFLERGLESIHEPKGGK